MNILILQHINIEDPGYIKDLMLADGWKLTTVELDEGETIPADLSVYDAMFCMGGPMDTWMEDEYPWLIDEKERLNEFIVELEKPFLGFCLGAQLLGEVVGGQVVRSDVPEIGMLDVMLTPNKSNDAIFSDYPHTVKALQWHSYEVQGLESNPNVTLLASSPTTKYQIFKYKDHAYGIQFHIEVKDDTVLEWGCVPEYKSALETSLGPNALQSFDEQAQANMANMNRCATMLYENMKRMIEA
ncbi:MAG: type 1 glutamine amidotransferase [Chloroflexota bacterium]